ncbi:MAG: hypothetical protein PHY47_24700 [Lachnospiraceae bacterium]|nr:hypothetical protein [Lachnospiraceae bacterium]
MTLSRVSELSRTEVPSLSSILLRGYILSSLFGWLGLLAGTSTAKRKTIYEMQITFSDCGVGIAEIDNTIYESLLDILLTSNTK